MMDPALDAAAPSGPRLTVTCVLGSPSVITVSGEADMGGTDLLQQAVDRALAHQPDLVFDLAGVTFADSTVLSMLLQARLSALELGGSVHLREPSTAIHRLLSITGALGLFPVTTAGQLKQP